MSDTEKKTKKVTFNLWAITRAQCFITKEVPIETTEEELFDMLVQLKDETSGTEYHEDPDYWEEGDGSFKDNEEGE